VIGIFRSKSVGGKFVVGRELGSSNSFIEWNTVVMEKYTHPEIYLEVPIISLL